MYGTIYTIIGMESCPDSSNSPLYDSQQGISTTLICGSQGGFIAPNLSFQCCSQTKPSILRREFLTVAIVPSDDAARPHLLFPSGRDERPDSIPASPLFPFSCSLPFQSRPSPVLVLMFILIVQPGSVAMSYIACLSDTGEATSSCPLYQTCHFNNPLTIIFRLCCSSQSHIESLEMSMMRLWKAGGPSWIFQIQAPLLCCVVNFIFPDPEVITVEAKPVQYGCWCWKWVCKKGQGEWRCKVHK